MALRSILYRRTKDTEAMDLTSLKDFVENKKVRCAEIHSDYDTAKQLITGLIYADFTSTWCTQHRVDKRIFEFHPN